MKTTCSVRTQCTYLLLHCRMAPQASSDFSTKYTVDQVTYVSGGAGGTTNSSRYRHAAFPCGYMRSVYFLCSFVTFTICCPSSHNSSNKLRQMLPSVILGGGAPPAIPSPTGLIPLRGCSTQQCTPAWRRSCDHQSQAFSNSTGQPFLLWLSSTTTQFHRKN